MDIIFDLGKGNDIDGIKHGNLYVAKHNRKIVGSIILNHVVMTSRVVA